MSNSTIVVVFYCMTFKFYNHIHKLDLFKKASFNFFKKIHRNANLFTWIYRDIIIGDKVLFIPNYDTQNYPFCRSQLVVKCIDA